MRFTSDKVKEINTTYEQDRENSHVKDMYFRLFDSEQGAVVYRKGLFLCTIEEVDDIIRELERMKACIQFETGIMM